MEIHRRVDRRRCRIVFRFAVSRDKAPAPVYDGREVLRSRAAAPAHDAHSVLGDESFQMVRELFRGEVVVHGAVYDRGESGIGLDGDGQPAVMGQVPDGFSHLGRPRRAVEPHHVRAHGIESAQRRSDLGAGQHTSGQLDGHLHLEWHAPSGCDHRALAGVQSSFGLEQVVDGFYDQEIDSACQKASRLFGVCVRRSSYLI